LPLTCSFFGLARDLNSLKISSAGFVNLCPPVNAPSAFRSPAARPACTRTANFLLRLGLLLLPAPGLAQTPQIISVPEAGVPTPPPGEAEFARVVTQLRTTEPVARTRALLQLGNFNLSTEQARDVVPLIVSNLRQWPARPYAAGSLSVQHAALLALWGVGPPGRAALPEVAAALDFDDLSIRGAAMNAVVRMNIRGADAAVVMPAVVRLLDLPPVADQDKGGYASAREKAVRWLAELGPAARPALTALVRLVSAESFPDFESSAFRAIAGVGPEGAEALPALLTILERDNEVWAPQFLVQAIAQVGQNDPRLRDPLLTLWRRQLELLPPAEPPGGAALLVAQKLRRLNGLIFWQSLSDPTVTRAVIQAVAMAPDWALQYSPMDGNGASAGPAREMALGNLLEARLKALSPRLAEVAPELVALVRRSADRPNARRLAILGLQKLEAVPDELLPVLAEQVEQTKSPSLWGYWAYPALESMGPRAAPVVPQLRAKLRDGDPSEQAAAAAVLAAIGRPAASSAIPELANVATKEVPWDRGSQALSLHAALLKLDPASATAREGLQRISTAAEDVRARIEAHRLLLEIGPEPDSHRIALTAMMTANDEGAALAATALVRDRGSPAVRAAAIDCLFRLLEPLVGSIASSGRGRSASPPVRVDSSAIYVAATGLEYLLPDDAGFQSRLTDLVRRLWQADRMRREESPASSGSPNVRFLMLIRVLVLLETKTPATQDLLAELDRDPQFLIREALAGRVNNGR
jgi:hypothetical protein